MNSLARSKKLITEIDEMVDNHDREYHPDRFCLSGHRIKDDYGQYKITHEEKCADCGKLAEQLRKAEDM